MRTIVRIIESISEWTGRAVSWACVALVLVLMYEVIARYVFDAPTNWALETSIMLGFTIAAIGWAYTHRHHGHISVDIISRHLSPRGKAAVDIFLSLFLLFPLLIILAYSSAWWVGWSLSMGEKMGQSTWYPPAAPIRMVLLLGVSLFSFQSVAQFIRDIYRLIWNKSYD